MPWLKKSLQSLLALAIVLVAVAYLFPRQVHVERAITIAAPPATVFALLDGYERFHDWSPWAALDPGAHYTREGPASGVGARLTWVGDPRKVGSGSQEIVESVPAELVRTKLDFGDDGRATAQFALYPDGDGTHVVWGFDTDLGGNPLARYVGPLFDGMIGPDYERGLENLKRLAESLPRGDAPVASSDDVHVPASKR